MKYRHMTSPSMAVKFRGVTLIELMVVVAIVAILAAVAYPSYESYIVRANRSAAQQLMIKVASREEQYRLDARSYTATIGAGGLNVSEDGWACAGTCTKNDGRYVVSVALVAGPPPGFTVTATPQGNQAAKDTQCGTMTLDANGTKTVTGGGGNAQCWKQ